MGEKQSEYNTQPPQQGYTHTGLPGIAQYPDQGASADDMVKRQSSETFDPSAQSESGMLLDPQMLANVTATGQGGAGVSYDELGQAHLSGMDDTMSKKARFVSDNNAPNPMNFAAMPASATGLYSSFGQAFTGLPSVANFGMGNATQPQSLQQQTQQQQQQLHHHQLQHNQAQHQQQLQQQLVQDGSPASPNFGAAGVHSSFSGGLLPNGAAMSGLPTPGSPYMSQQHYAAALAASVGPGSGNQMQNFSSPQGPQGGPFMNAPSNLGGGPGMFSLSAPFGNTHPAALQNVHAGMASFMPNMGMLGSPPQASAAGRTVYVGNLPAEASVDELLSLVKFGPIENVRVLAEKSCAFISFLDGNMAAAFHADASVKKLSLHNQELKIGWGKPSACPTPVLMAVQQQQATRNVYLGQLDEDTTEQSLRDDLARFGPIDQVKIVRDKNIGFVHFLSIGTAMKVVSLLPNEPSWSGKRVNYGKDRCAYVPKSQQQNQAHNNMAAAMGMAAAASLGYPTGLNAAFAGFEPMGPASARGPQGAPSNGEDQGRSPAAVASVFAPMANSASLQQMGNRTVYLGNIHPDTTTEEICNHVRGGVMQNIRFIPEKHIAFITFVDSNAALAFYHLATYSGVMIHQRRLKIGWGKHSGPLNPAIAMAVQSGGSRNVYVGNIEDFDFHTTEKLRRDFGEYGETELVNSLKEKNCVCVRHGWGQGIKWVTVTISVLTNLLFLPHLLKSQAFVNFCNIQNAIKAIEAMKNHPDYQNQRIGAGKDRCGNAPRAVANTLGAARGGPLSPDAAGGLPSEGMPGDASDPLSPPPSSAPAGNDTTNPAGGIPDAAAGLGTVVPHENSSSS